MDNHNFHVDSDAIYTSLMESIDDYIYIGDLTTNMYYISSNMVIDFSFESQWVEDLVSAWGEFIHPHDRKRFFDSIDDMLTGKTDSHNLEYQVRNKLGNYIWVHCKGKLLRDPQTNVPRSFAGVVKKPENMGRIDTVTGLFTHEKCQEVIQQLFESNNPWAGGFLLLGIDDFKKINTLLDHKFGDQVLRDAAQLMQSLLPSGSYLYRFDGDQFCILDFHATKDSLLALYEKIRSAVCVKRCIDNHHYEFTISGGAVTFDQTGPIWENIVKCASVSLKSAKSSGKNQCLYFSNEFLDYELHEQQLVQIMSDSIKENFKGFFLVYQPINNAQTLSLMGGEALLRFEHPLHGKIFPDEFIPLLETTGLIIPVGNWVLSEAVQFCKKCIVRNPDFVMNVNVSYLQFQNPDFPSFVKKTLDTYGLPSKHITLEMTESFFATDNGQTWDSLQQLREIGVNIAIDDFGTGYSSLGRLSKLNADYIKIDQLFIRTLNHSPYNREFILSIVRLCHSTGMSVCLEGVETEGELSDISELNADTLQGFYFSKPVSEEEFLDKFL